MKYKYKFIFNFFLCFFAVSAFTSHHKHNSIVENSPGGFKEKMTDLHPELILASGLSNKSTDKKSSLIDSNWYQKVMQNIKNDEYNITYSKELNAYQSPNRANNFRFVYYKDGFSVSPRTTEIPLFDMNDKTLPEKDKKYKTLPDWKIKFELTGYGREGNYSKFNGTEINVSKNTAYCEDSNMKITYLNNEKGMRQDFIIKSKPEENSDKLVLKFRLNTKLKTELTPDGIKFLDRSNAVVMHYSSLYVTDANGKVLNAKFQKVNSTQYKIIVDDKKAVYPVTVDPLSTTPNWTAESNQDNAHFGNSVSTAGDVNGDGYSDVIVGADYYDNGQTNEGRAFVYHGTASGLMLMPNWMTESNKDFAYFGCSVSSAGDVNGDGYSDVIVGAFSFTNGHGQEGRAFVYYGSSSGLSLTPNWTAESDQAGAWFGYSVSTAGDVNGDGYSDVIVGADYYDNGQTDEGRAYIYHGSSSGLSLTPNWTAESNQSSANFGNSVSSAGDVNRDGYSDVIVGAYNYDNGRIDEGCAYVYHGSSSGLSLTPNWTAESNQYEAKFGYSVSTAGDVNGDGYSDVIVGAWSYDNGQTDEGCAFVYHGSSTGLSLSPNWTAEGNQGTALFGGSVSTAGDVNGDGYSEVIVGASNYYNGQTFEGGAFVYHGSPSGLLLIPNWAVEGELEYARFGTSVSTAGDVNGDGYSDVIVGADFYYNGQIDEGSAFVYHGSATGLLALGWYTEVNQANSNFGITVSTAGDVNGDGYGDVIVGAPYYDGSYADGGRIYIYHGSSSGLSSSYNFAYNGSQANSRFGSSVSTAGDVNGDGYSDVIIGAFYYDNPQVDEGRVYVFHGSASGITLINYWTAESNQESAYFGFSVSTAGDVNGDGFSDVIVGTIGYDNGATNEGKAFVYHGSSSGLSASADWSAESNQSNSMYGFSVSCAGDVNGDGFSDVIVGAYNYDNDVVIDGGRVFVYHGSAYGLPAAESWTFGSGQTGALLGYSVASAGDVNGDGYCDILIAAYNYDFPETDEGRVFVYNGSNSGLSSVANWAADGNQAGGHFGNCVASAGDINSDGYSDVIIGASYYDNGPTDDGRTYLYIGSSSGLVYSWYNGGGQDGAQFGFSVSSAGDVNGDGYSDVIVGAPNFDNTETNEGRVYVYYGNGGSGLRSTVQQYKFGTSTVIAPLGLTGLNGSVRLNGFSKSPFGRADGKLVWEIKENGQPFSGPNSVSYSGMQPGYTDISSTGQNLVQDISGIPPMKEYKWRVRVKFSPVNNPYQVYGPWRYYTSYMPVPWGCFKAQDLPLPVDLLNFSYTISDNNVILKWSTLKEINNKGFYIERKSLKNENSWVNIAFVSGNGTTNEPRSYSFIDKGLTKGVHYYRLKQTDFNGNYEYHTLAGTVNIGVPKDFSVSQNYPNPSNPKCKIDYCIPIDAKVTIKIYDIIGREVALLVNEFRPADYYSVEFDGTNFASGMYFYNIIAGNYTKTKKMILLK